MARSTLEDDDPGTALASPVTDQNDVVRFLEACRQVQTQAAALCSNTTLPTVTREMLKDLRLRLLTARKALLSPEAVASSGKTADASEEALIRRPLPANPLAPHVPRTPPR